MPIFVPLACDVTSRWDLEIILGESIFENAANLSCIFYFFQKLVDLHSTSVVCCFKLQGNFAN